MNEIDKLKLKIAQMEKQIEDLNHKIQTIGDSSYKTGSREYINHEIQFLQKCYNKDGVLITQINT